MLQQLPPQSQPRTSILLNFNHFYLSLSIHLTFSLLVRCVGTATCYPHLPTRHIQWHILLETRRLLRSACGGVVVVGRRHANAYDCSIQLKQQSSYALFTTVKDTIVMRRWLHETESNKLHSCKTGLSRSCQVELQRYVLAQVILQSFGDFCSANIRDNVHVRV